jgi:hypothetical protein
MNLKYNTCRSRGKASACLKRVDRKRDCELLAIPAIRAIARRSRVSPATAALLAELSGLLSGGV